jgi:hypothetical protein
VCMGCRARAFAATGNYLDEEPFCVYVPHSNTPHEKSVGPMEVGLSRGWVGETRGASRQSRNSRSEK